MGSRIRVLLGALEGWNFLFFEFGSNLGRIWVLD